jgi:hypothetical protein
MTKEVNKSLIYDSQVAASGLADFVQTLPPQLQIAVSIHIYKTTFQKHPFFLNLRDKRMLAYIGQSFHPCYYQTGQYLYQIGDEITSFKIATKGIAAFVQPHYHNQIYAIVNANNLEDNQKPCHRKVFQHCGFEDTVINHTLFIKNLKDGVMR